MKRLVFFVLLLFLLSFSVGAEEYTYSADGVGEERATEMWDELIDALPDDIADEMADFSLSYGDAGKADLGYWLSLFCEHVGESVRALFPSLAVLFSLLLLIAVARAWLPEDSAAKESFLALCALAVAVPLAGWVYRAAEIATTTLGEFSSFLDFLTPLMDLLYLTEGSVNAAGVMSSGVVLAVTVISNINAYVMAPVTTVLFTFSALSCICTEMNLVGMTAALRKLIMRLWQIVTLFFSFLIGTQSVIAKSADSLSSRTARFAIGTLIPVAGGILAEAYNTVKEGVSYLRAVSGIGGIVIVVLILLSSAVPLLVYKAVFAVLSFTAGMLKLERCEKLLEEIKGILDLFFAMSVYTALMLVFALILFTKSRESGGGL